MDTAREEGAGLVMQMPPWPDDLGRSPGGRGDQRQSSAPLHCNPVPRSTASEGEGTRSKSRPVSIPLGNLNEPLLNELRGEELGETGGDGGGIPARQVVARTRYQHRVDFWNPPLQ